ncbi:hypothetical protein CIB84_006794 [Bambusicola thoracicus]|uniref:Reelin domain-containing protein n=1 Tax=Bambusicola thoracicus TaxID=9083 RepID=A0A2P4SZB4_BAMTH|nr:hypothetical protein CIB84_006794 [Bambusicola thoracicus]
MERRRGVPGGWSCLLAALGALLAAGRAATPRARFSPFFFLCTHHGELEGDGEQGEVLIALHIAGNPAAYVPGQEYHGMTFTELPTSNRRKLFRADTEIGIEKCRLIKGNHP